MDGQLQVDLRGKLAVVVGGNQGLGATIAVALAESGCRLVIAARDERRLAETQQQVREVSEEPVEAMAVDVTSPDSIAAFSGAVLDVHGPPTILVNSAGGNLRRPAFDVTVDDWDRIVDTHVRGTFLVSQAFGRPMADEGYGKIINLSSTWASTTAPGRSVYCAAKAAVSHLTAALATEWAPLGVRVNALAPTAAMTPRIARRLEVDPDQLEFTVRRIPLGRLAVPQDIAGAALFLAAPASDFVTGHTLYVDGGWQFSK